MNIRQRIILQSLAFLILSAAATNGFLLFSGYQTLQNNSHEQAVNLAGTRAQRLETDLNIRVADLQTLAGLVSASIPRKNPVSPEVLRDYLTDRMDGDNGILGGGWYLVSDTVKLGTNSRGHINVNNPNDRALSPERQAFFAQQPGLVVFSRFDDPAYGEPYLCLFQPLKTLSGTPIGGVYFDLSLKPLAQSLAGPLPFEGAYTSLFDAEGTYLSHPKSTHPGQNFRQMDQFSGSGGDTPQAIMDNLKKGSSFQLIKFSKSTGTSVLRFYHPIMVGSSMALTLAVSLPVAALSAPFFSQLGLTMTLLLGLTAANMVVLILVLTRTLGPLGTLKHRVAEWTSGDGDLTCHLPDGDKTEVGEVSRTLNTFRENLRLMVVTLQDQTRSLETLSVQLGGLSQQSAAATEQMAAASTQAAQVSQRQLAQAETTKAAVENVLTRIEKNHTLTQEISREIGSFQQALLLGQDRNRTCFAQVKHTETLVGRLHVTGEEGKRSMAALREAVGQVSNRAQEIQEIAGFILDIADRTNLLSMNAAIEAARAGFTGRGFAVVASEIRQLAESSSRQAQGIKALLEGISLTVADTLHQAQNADQTFDRLHQDIAAVKRAAQEITQVMEAQARFDAHLGEGLDRFVGFTGQLSATMDTNVQDSRRIQVELETLQASSTEIRQAMEEQKIGMDETASAAQQVRETAGAMEHIVRSIHGKIDQFKT